MDSLAASPTAVGRYPPLRLPGAEEPHPPVAARPARPGPPRVRQARGCRTGDPQRSSRSCSIARAETTPLSLYERESLITRRAQRAVRPRSARRAAARPGHLGHPGQPLTTQVYIERNGVLELTSVVFKDDRHLLRIIERIVSAVGRRIDESSPMVDARLADGSRVNAIIPPIALDGPAVSIRRFRTDRPGRAGSGRTRDADAADARLPARRRSPRA